MCHSSSLEKRNQFQGIQVKRNEYIPRHMFSISFKTNSLKLKLVTRPANLNLVSHYNNKRFIII